jgi:hypothetical protein
MQFDKTINSVNTFQSFSYVLLYPLQIDYVKDRF